MTDFSLSYREVIPDQNVLDSWKEITLTTGGTQSTLQDIKVAEKANGYCYEDSTKTHTRNRFIYWRINNDVLELVEHSLDINLTGNRIRYKIVDTPILDGVSIHESIDNVIVLVPTVCSVHRLVFPHPDRFYRQNDVSTPSIFSKASALEAKNPNTFYVFNNPHSANQLPNLACSYLSVDTEEAYFVLAYPSTEMLLIKQTKEGQCTTIEMKGESLMPRFLSGLAEKFRQRNNEAESIISLLILQLENELYTVTLCREGHLKFWSCSKGQCLAVIDILSEMGDGNIGLVQRAALRKAVNSYHTAENTLAVFLSFSIGCQFHILKPAITGQQIRIIRLNTLHSPENDLIDFALQPNRLWSAFRCSDGESAVYSAALFSNSYETSNWTPVVLEPLLDADSVTVNDEMDPRQIYLQHIFHPGRFPLHIINKALCIYRRSASMADTTLSASVLKQSICMAVEAEAKTVMNEQVVNDQEYIECLQWCWQKFYSCCVQYHVAGMKPLGLLLLPAVSGAVFLKKSSFSFLRPLEPLEHMTLCSDNMYRDQFVEYPLLGDDLDGVGDVMNLFEVIVYVDKEMSEIFSATFERELSTLQSPDVVMSDLVQQIHTEMDSEFTSQVAGMLGQCTDLYKAVHKILELLRYENLNLAESHVETNPSVDHHFSSHLGVSFVSSCIRQQAVTRFTICRNLLLICNVLLDRRELDWSVLEALRSVCMPEIVVFTQASYVMTWLSGLQGHHHLHHDASLQRLAPIKLTSVDSLRTKTLQSVSLLEMFISSSGGQEARKTFGRIKYCDEDLAHWHLSLLPYLHHLRHIIWPVGGSTVLAEWLLSSGQHLWLQQYVRLLSNWCEWNSCTRNFLLAASLLTSGENYKALDLFLTAVKGIFLDKFLEERFLKDFISEESHTKAYLNYYLKVIQLFELHKAKDCAINVANAALSVVDRDDPLMATLYSIKFKHHLSLKHYEMAFDALYSNPDLERRKDNLRDLVKSLLDEKKLDVLMNFTYGSMEEYFTNILLTRARAADAVNNIYYDFLYSYQIKRGPLCHRLAASVMYEQAFRLSQINTPEALEKQVKCYLAAKNVLHLCDQKYSWIVRPTDPEEGDEEIVIEPRAGTGTVEDLQVVTLQRQVEVLNIDAIKKELLFASAKLKLSRFNDASSTNITTPNELVLLLNKAGLFKIALKICTVFNLSYEPVFETLAKHCVLITEQEHPNAWEWLMENDLQDLPVNRDSIADVVWQFLRDCLETYEEPHMTVLHYVVTRKIIDMKMFIPFWLMASYKERNAGELLKLLHRTGRLEEAAELTKDYLSAAMGYGKELYGFQTPLTHTSKPFCLAVYAIKNLIDELAIQNSQMNMDPPFEKEYDLLSELFNKYLQTSERISNQMERETFSKRVQAPSRISSEIYKF
ncbi:nuclear pore complex protein Nup160 homolog isoform X2 [Aethina tumida]|uniref:nuclear pore complex protein Nup160 homolog isoform X2 n=1 Tax=Aethina tumida TaxID=116153 RepID=UPI002148151D|nr:nuclear pore complex protein Nup160 homolog isoform X2 [Aethina tumida]